MGRTASAGGSAEAARYELLSDPTLPRRVPTRPSGPATGVLGRRAELLGRLASETRIEQFSPIAQVRTNLQARVARFRPVWKGRPTLRAVVRDVVRRSPNRGERKGAFYAEDPLFVPLEDAVRDLTAARNDRARDLGYRSYPDFVLRMEGLSVDALREILEEISAGIVRRTRQLRTRFARQTGLEDWYPWDIDYLRETEGGLPDEAFPGRSMVAEVREGVRAWGFRDAQLQFRVDRHDLPMGGIEIPLDPPRDVRIIVHPRAGWQYYMILFHEMGHAVHARSVRVPTHLLRWHEYLPGFRGFVEGVGTLFEEIPNSREWLATRRGIPESRREAFRDGQQGADLVRLVKLIESVQTELELFLRPGRDPRIAGARYLRRMLDLDEYRPLSFVRNTTITHPFYVQSYILAKIWARQILRSMRSEIGGPLWPNARFGPWLTRNWFRWGATYDWLPRTRSLTGHPLNSRALLESLSEGGSAGN